MWSPTQSDSKPALSAYLASSASTLTDPPEIVSVPKDYTSFIHLEICLEGFRSVSIDRFSEPLVGLWQGFDDHVREPNPGGDETLRVSDIDVQPADWQGVGRGGDPKVDVP